MRPDALGMIARFAIDALRDPSFPHVLRRATDQLCDTLACTRAGVLVEVTGAELELHAPSGWPPGAAGTRFPADDPRSLPLHVLRSAAPTLVTDYAAPATPFAAPPDQEGTPIRSAVAVPIQGAGATRGVLLAESTDAYAFHPADLEIVRTVAEVLGAAAARAQARADADEFASLVAHEMRTPLTSVIGFSRRLLRQLHRDGHLGAEHREELRLILREGQRMRRTIDLLRTLGQLDRSTGPTWERAPLTLAPHAEHVVARAREYYPDHTFEVAVPADLQVDADEVALEHVLANLVENGAKYSPAGSTIAITAGAADAVPAPPGGGDGVALTVADGCGGLTEEDLQRVFQRRYRGSAAGRAAGGLGLGLYLAKRITEQLGGRLEVRDDPGRGCAFTLTLPVPPGSDPSGPPGPGG